LSVLSQPMIVRSAGEEKHTIGLFSQQATDGWREHAFASGTQYKLKQADDGVWALSADSQDGASAYFKAVDIDLDKTPILHWRWQVLEPLIGLPEMSKVGDDYAARVYVVHKRGFFDKGTAINYVWSGSYPVGARWPNAFAKQSSVMIALRNHQSPLGQWQSESRDVRKDFLELMGEDVRSIQLVVLMTDTDNSGLAAGALYGDLFFSER
ncbi:MAG: DUF3047 domain-containing protein, partial [Granulosicoccaceae bacterium]